MVFLLLNLLYIKFSEKKIIKNSLLSANERKLMNVPSFSLPKRTKKKITSTTQRTNSVLKLNSDTGKGRVRGKELILLILSAY